MHKEYRIYRSGNRFLVERKERKKIESINSVKLYNRIIEKFIENGYEVSLSGEDMILNGDDDSITIQKYREIKGCKYMDTLYNDIKKTIEEKGFIVYKNPKSKPIRIKKQNVEYEQPSKIEKILKRIKEKGAVIGITASLMLSLLLSGWSITSSFINIKGNQKNSYEEEIETVADTKPEEVTEEVAKLETPEIDIEKLIQEHQISKSIIMSEEYLKTALEAAGAPIQEKGPTKEEIEQQRIEEYDNYIKEYASYFHMDPEKVAIYAKKVTENYTLPFEEVNGTSAYDIDNKEAACLIFVHNLFKGALPRSLAQDGLTLDYFIINYNVTPLPYDKIIANGLTFEQFLGKVSDLLKVDKYWALAICYLETGRVTSNLARAHNNFGGMRGNGGFYTYISPEAGVISFLRNLKSYEYKNINSIQELSGIYVYGNRSQVQPTWIASITAFHNSFIANSDQIFLIETKAEEDIITRN